MKVIVIGGTGHIGSFLIPLLVQAGHEVVIVAGGRRPVPQTKDWKSVETVKPFFYS